MKNLNIHHAFFLVHALCIYSVYIQVSFLSSSASLGQTSVICYIPTLYIVPE